MQRLGIALVGFAALGAVACAGILGIQDRALDTSDGGSGSSSGSDSSGGCSTDPCAMLTGLNHPFMIAADDSNVYWTEFGDDQNSQNGSVKSCPASGCGAGPLVYAVVQSSPRGIAVDAQKVYWGTSTSQTQNGAIWSCPIAGCNGQPTMVVAANAPFGVALDGTYVYWADNYDDTVHRAPKAGGADNVLWDAGGSVGLNNGQEVAVDGTYAFVTDNDFNLFRLPIAGGSLVQMYAQSGGWFGAAPIAVDPSGIYLGAPGQILRFDKTVTGGRGTPIVSTVAGPSGLTIDPAAAMLYWSDWGSGTGTDGTVGKVPLDGGASTVLEQSQTTPEAVAVSGTYVFWLSNGTLTSSGGATIGTGALYRTKK
jgi:hypothetical protein